MGGMGSGGAGMVAELRRQARREESRREAKRARRQARMQAIREQRALGSDLLEHDRWPFACASICGACGLLEPPHANTQHDPHRASPSAGTRTCAACGSAARGFIDLANRGMARALVDQEIDDRAAGSQLLSKVAWATAGLGTATASVMMATAAGNPVLGVFAGALALLFAGKGMPGSGGSNKRRTVARRWRHTRLRLGATTTTTSGRTSGTTLTAPLSGRACVAYEVRVVWHGAKPDVVKNQALREQCTMGLEVEGERVEDVYLDRPCERLETDEVLASEAAVRYLATRGLEPTDGAFDYYEVVVLEGDEAHVESNEHGQHRIW